MATGSDAVILGPGEAGYRLDQLRDAWNQLRNDVLGRGVFPPPNVPPPLVKEIGDQYEAFRGWYENATQSLADVAAVHMGSEFARELADWTDEYKRLRDAALVAGVVIQAPDIAPPTAPKTPGWLWPTVVAGAFGLGALWLFLRRPARQPARLQPAPLAFRARPRQTRR